jgi:pyridoxamine 5'-phosphate oxidase
MTATDIAALRTDYSLKTLDESQVDRDPMKQFGVWMVEAIHAQVPEPTAMSLSTIGPDGRPAGRIVLLKGVDARGFVFYTNYRSRKGRDLAAHPWPRSRSCGRSSSARCASRATSSR